MTTYLRTAGYSRAQRNLCHFGRRYGIPRYALSRMLQREAAGQSFGHYPLICAVTAGLEQELQTKLDPRDLFPPPPLPNPTR